MSTVFVGCQTTYPDKRITLEKTLKDLTGNGSKEKSPLN
jgi:hypothetical protein